MRLLLVNANTSDHVTGKVRAAAIAAAPPGVEIVAVTGEFGARVITTRSEHAIAEYSAVALAAKHAPGCDAVIIAVSYDTGLRAVREMLSVPVVGMTEAAFLTACMLGGPIGVIGFGRRVMPLYRELVASYGLAGRIAGWRAMESNAPYASGEHPELDREIVRTAVDLVERDGAESIVLTGAVMGGVPRRLQAHLPVPMVDGITCGVQQALALVALGLPKPSTGSYASPGIREVTNVDPALAARFAGPDAKGRA